MTRITKLVMPKQTQYKKHCYVCGKDFTCDGMCGKREGYKTKIVGTCYCASCYIKEYGSCRGKLGNCTSRFGKDANPAFTLDIKEKVIFT